MRDACVRLAASLLGYTILATPALAATNVASLAHGALITGPVNCSGSRGKPPVAIDGETRAYGRSWGYMWGYLNTPLVVRFRERVSINVVDMLLLDVDGRDYGYVIETSTEDGRWLPAVNRASARDKSWQTHRFTSRTTRSLRVTFTRTSVQARSYHVVEIAAYSLPKGVTETPLRRAWERPRFPIPPTDTQLLGAESVLRQLQDPDRVGQVRRLKPGAQARWDTDGDGVPDMLITREQAGVVVAVDDNGDMSATTEEADGTDDCLVIDLKGDGTLDRAVDYMDWDSSGFADTMVQTYVSGSPWGSRALVLIRDLDERGPKRLWHLTPQYGYSQGGCQWHCDFGGDGYFVMFGWNATTAGWEGRWENPFCFYDPDGDGFPEETVRVSGTGGRLRSVRYGINADNDAPTDQDYDYDMSVTVLGAVVPPRNEFTRFRLRSGSYTGDYLKWERTRQVVRELAWKRALLVWDEDDRNVAPSRGSSERWEGVLNAAYRGFPQEGGPHCGTANKRYELDGDFSGRMKLYYWPADQRLHLVGAEQGTMVVDYDRDGETDLTVEYHDRDGDGFFDAREIICQRLNYRRSANGGPSLSKAIHAPMPLDFSVFSAPWKDALSETLAAQEEVLSAIARVSGRTEIPNGPMAYFRTVTRREFPGANAMRKSPEARRYYQDLEVELALASLLKGDTPRPLEAAFTGTVTRARRFVDGGCLREAAALLRGARLPGATHEPHPFRPVFPGNAFAMLGRKITAGWESGIIAYRAYWGKIDVFGKVTAEPRLALFDAPGVDYHRELKSGMDVLHVGKTSGLGGLNIWHSGQRLPAQWGRADDATVPIEHDVRRAGPEAAEVLMLTRGWDTPCGRLDIVRRLTIASGQRHTEDNLEISCTGTKALEFGPGITRLGDGQHLTSAGKGYVATWGDQEIGAGPVGLGVVFDPTLCRRIETTPDEFLVHLTAQGPKITTQLLLAGAWARAGHITRAEDWFAYMKGLAATRSER